jgi:rhodanese-related sulfurtransferase
MTKRTQILVGVLLVLALVLTGCGRGRTTEEPTEAPAAEAPLAEAESATDTPEPEATVEEAAADTAEPEATVEEATAEPEATAAETEAAAGTEQVAMGGVVFDAVNEYMSNIPEGFMAVGDIEKFKEILDTGEATLIDVREPSEYEAGHIPGAVNIPLRTLAQNLDKVPSDAPVMVYCASGHRAGMATSSLRSLGYDNVRAYPPGFKGWSEAGEEVSTDAVEGETYDVPEIDPELMAAVDGFLSNIPEGWYAVGDVEKFEAALDAGAPLFDVREPGEFEEGSIPGAVNVPIREVAARSAEIPMDEQSFVYCASGFRAALSTAALHILGHEGVRSFPPGYPGWEAADGEAAGEGAEVPAEVAAAVESDTAVVDGVDAFLSAIPEGFLAVGQIDAFQDAIANTNPYLIDVREPSEYEEGHIPGAVNIPLRTLADNLDQVPTDQPVFVYCASGHRAGQALASLGMLGYDNVKAFPPGWKGWTAADGEVSTDAVEPGTFELPEIDPQMLAAVADYLNNIPEGRLAVHDAQELADAMDNGAVVIDVREPSEYAEGYIPGAINIPLRTLAQNLDQVPTDQPVVVYCASGHRAAIALASLRAMGYSNVRAFPGGYPAWEAAGEEVAVAQ